MRIVLDGRRTSNGNVASYFENKACFTRTGWNKRIVLHELYHHLVYTKKLELPRVI